MIFGLTVGYGILPLTKNIVEKTGTGGWFSLLIATIISVIYTYIWTYLGYIHENKTVDEYSKELVGKYISFIFVSIYIIYSFVSFTVVVRLASELTKLIILIKTPIWILSLMMFIIVYYAVIKGLRSIARLCEIYGVIIIIAFLITITALFTQGKLINLKPFFITEDIKMYIKAIPVTITPLIGMELIGIIPLNRKINNKKVFKYTTIMVGFIGILYILEVEACVSIMGESVINYKDVFLAAVRRTDIPALQFLQRLDGILIVFWLMGVFCTIILWGYGVTLLTSKYCKKIHFNFVALIVVVVGFILSRVPKTLDQADEILNYATYLGFIFTGIIPIILIIITKIKKYD